MAPPRPHPRVRVAISTLMASAPEFALFDSWTSMARYDVLGEHGNDGHQHLLAGGEIKLLSGPRVAEGRTQVVERFLSDPLLKGVDWLAMIDSDMGCEPDAICQLLGHAYDGNASQDPYEPECPIIGGLCFAGNHERAYPTLYRAVEHESGQIVPERLAEPYPRNALVKVAATGAAFLLVHRKVLRHMALDHPRGFGTDMRGDHNPYPWFAEGANRGVQFGEDVAFCLRANALGYPTYVHTGVRIDHIKKFALNEAHVDALAELAWYRENHGDYEEHQVDAAFRRMRERRPAEDVPLEALGDRPPLVLPPQPVIGAAS